MLNILFSERISAYSLGISSDQRHIIAGYSDSSIKVYDINTQEVSNKNIFDFLKCIIYIN